jgi:hypothetical protein
VRPRARGDFKANRFTKGVGIFGTLKANAIHLAGTLLSFTAAQFNQIMAAFGTVTFDRGVKVARVALVGTTIHAASGFAAWQNPEAGDILILDAHLVTSVVSTGAGTIDVGTTPTSATTTSDNIFDGIDAAAAVPAYYSMRNDALDSAANVEIKALATGKWVTIDEKTGDLTGFVGVLYIKYINA